MAVPAAIAWPDAMPTPTLDQPTRARIVAVSPRDVASPFDHRGEPVSWFEVRIEIHPLVDSAGYSSPRSSCDDEYLIFTFDTARRVLPASSKCNSPPDER